MFLTPENYDQGFLIDEELMGGVAQDPSIEGNFVAFVVSSLNGEYLGYQSFPKLAEALNSLNSVQRRWIFERSGGCGGGKCEEGFCNQGQCQIRGKCEDGACSPVAKLRNEYELFALL